MAQLYWYVSDLGLTITQRNTLLAQLRLLMLDPNSPQPAKRNHWLVSLVGDSCIFEADVDIDNLSATSFKARLASLFNVAASTLTYVTTTTEYGPVVTLKYNNTNKLRVGVFGGLEADWGLSQALAKAYIRDNLVLWKRPTI